MGHKGIVYLIGHWIRIVREGTQWRDLPNKAIYLRVFLNTEIFVTTLATISISVRVFLHVIGFIDIISTIGLKLYEPFL